MECPPRAALVWTCLLLGLGMLIHGIRAQNSPEDILRVHNAARAEVGVDPLSWNDTVAAYAQKYANQRIADCKLARSGGPYGENIFWGSSRSFTASDAVKLWLSEKDSYDNRTKRCASGRECKHYLQVVSANSVRLGCAAGMCNSGANFFICNYDPPDNAITHMASPQLQPPSPATIAGPQPQPPSSATGERHRPRRSVIIIVPITISAAILLAAAGAWYFWTCARKQGYASKTILLGAARNERLGSKVPFYSLRDVKAATNNFCQSNYLGKGGFGTVYRGVLRGGEEVAIKRLSKSSEQGLEEFMNEVQLIAKFEHINLVQLLGCCAEGEEKILIYEYLPNKSLNNFLFDPSLSKQLDWEKRLKIVTDIARGLQYLHQESRLKVVHRDIKTSNILLDAAMNPKISDFGLAKPFGDEQTHISTRNVAGTKGYMAPEYAIYGHYSAKSDVYSFGVMVLEIVSGQQMRTYCNEQSLNLLGHAWKLWNEDKVRQLLDHSPGMPPKLEQVLRCAIVGLLCVQNDAGDRPTMSSVVTMLSSDSANLASPKQPAYYGNARPPDGGSTPIESKPGNSSRNGVTISELQPR